MADSTLVKRTQAVRSRWSEAEKRRRAAVARRRCAALLARFNESERNSAARFWAAGAMSLDDVARIAG